MPIVDVELVSGVELDPDLASSLADTIGEVLGAPEGTTWVRLHRLDPSCYAESGGPVGPDIRPVFLEILTARMPDRTDRGEQARRLTAAVAAVTGHPEQNVHVVFSADGRGRVAFGGHLVE